ncbi:MAG: hypothetical protein ACLFQR_09825, partial [Desulfovibrionales bacterium]
DLGHRQNGECNEKFEKHKINQRICELAYCRIQNQSRRQYTHFSIPSQKSFGFAISEFSIFFLLSAITRLACHGEASAETCSGDPCLCAVLRQRWIARMNHAKARGRPGRVEKVITRLDRVIQVPRLPRPNLDAPVEPGHDKKRKPWLSIRQSVNSPIRQFANSPIRDLPFVNSTRTSPPGHGCR